MRARWRMFYAAELFPMIFVQTSESKEDPLRSQMKDFCGFQFQPTGLMKICVAVGDAGYPTIHDKIKKHLHSSAKSLFAFDRTFAPLILTTISKNHEQVFMMKCEVEGRLNPEGNTRKNHTTRETFELHLPCGIDLDLEVWGIETMDPRPLN
jgi:hypothetical protein